MPPDKRVGPAGNQADPKTTATTAGPPILPRAAHIPAEPHPRKREWPGLDRVLDRRRAQRELDELLGRPSRPDLARTYGVVR
jgi:hypothetical protein